jgi:hypothetical protein
LAAGLRSSTTPELAEQLEAHRGVPDKPFATIFARKTLTWRAIPIAGVNDFLAPPVCGMDSGAG